ncbi:MAG: amidohydrolase family protein, partial [Gammaproteobacteria bacterium]
MKTITTLLGLLFAPLVLADTTLVYNVNGYTLNAQRELLQFSGLLFEEDRVIRLFARDAVLPVGVDDSIDGAGRTLIPGLIDAHGHVSGYGQSLLSVNLVGTETEQEAAERVRLFAEQNPELEWIQGRGWNQVLWDSNTFPTAASLDAVVADRPVWLRRVDGHAAWGNSLAM